MRYTRAKRQSEGKKAGRSFQKTSRPLFRLGGVVLLALIAIIVLVIVRPLGVGKAVETAGGDALDVRYEEGKMTVTINSVQPVNGVSFDLLLEALPCGGLSFSSNMLWEYEESSCDSTGTPHRHTYGIASITEAEGGNFTVVTISPSVDLPDSFSVRLENIDVFSGSLDLFPTGADSGTFAVTASPASASEEPAPAGAPSGGSGGGSSGGGGGGGSGGGSGRGSQGAFSTLSVESGNSLTCTRKWQCSAWSDCQDGKETRTCTDVNQCQPTKAVKGKSYPVFIQGPESPAQQQDCVDVPLIAEPDPLPPIVEKPAVSRFLEEEKAAVIGVPSILLLLISGILFYNSYRRKNQGLQESSPK